MWTTCFVHCTRRHNLWSKQATASPPNRLFLWWSRIGTKTAHSCFFCRTSIPMFSTVQQSRQTSASGETQLPNNWMLSPDSTPPISPKSSFNDDMEDNATNPCKDRTAIADGLSPDTPPCQFGNACLIHANCMTYDPISSNDHDLKTWEVEKIKGHPSSPSSHSGVLFPSPPLVSNIGSLDFSEDTHENVKMLVTVLDLDVFQGDVKPDQDTNENVGHSVATIFSDSSEHSVEAPSPDIGANGHQPGTLCNTCSVVSPVVSSYGTGGPMQGVALPVDGGVPLNAAIENNHELVMALAHWTAEWLYSLIVQPHQRKGQPFACVQVFLSFALTHDISFHQVPRESRSCVHCFSIAH